MTELLIPLVAALCIASAPDEHEGASKRLELRDGDRIVLVGGSLAERAQTSGYIETAITARQPELALTFRNIGWSGDTVFGDSRPYGRRGSVFGDREEGFQNLVRQIRESKPSVMFVAYGFNESFARADGVEAFRDGLVRLLTEIAKITPRIALISPVRQAAPKNSRYPIEERLRNLSLYRDVLAQEAEARHLLLIDLFHLSSRGGRSFLDAYGIHPNELGYHRIATAIELSISGAATRRDLRVDAKALTSRVAATKLSKLASTETGLRFELLDERLPTAPLPPDAPGILRASRNPRTLSIVGLDAGSYALQVDGKTVARGSAAQWARGLPYRGGPEENQVERLRSAIVKKNRLFFHRWRPRNVAFISGERKREQVPSHGDVPKFTPLVEEIEKKIVRLRRPITHRYEIVREEGVR
jgi:lysophospholipase L1-like esterase